MLSILEISKTLQSIKNRTRNLVFKKKQKKVPLNALRSVAAVTKNRVYGNQNRFDPRKSSRPSTKNLKQYV